jgi:hypothetical protein
MHCTLFLPADNTATTTITITTPAAAAAAAVLCCCCCPLLLQVVSLNNELMSARAEALSAEEAVLWDLSARLMGVLDDVELVGVWGFKHMFKGLF